MKLTQKKHLLINKILHLKDLSKGTRNILIANTIGLFMLIVACFFSSESFIFAYIASLSTAVLVIVKYRLDIEIENLYLELGFLIDNETPLD